MGGKETTVSFGEEVGNLGALPGRGRWLLLSAGLGRLRLTVLSSGTNFVPMKSEGMLDLPERWAAPGAVLRGPEAGRDLLSLQPSMVSLVHLSPACLGLAEPLEGRRSSFQWRLMEAGWQREGAENWGRHLQRLLSCPVRSASRVPLGEQAVPHPGPRMGRPRVGDRAPGKESPAPGVWITAARASGADHGADVAAAWPRSQMGDWGPGGRPRAQEERKGSPQPGEWAGVTVSALPGLTPASP